MGADQVLKIISASRPKNPEDEGPELNIIPRRRRIASVPESKQDRFKRIARSRLDTQELTAELVSALEDVSRIPGMIEHSRWGSVTGSTAKVIAKWKLDDDEIDPAVVGEHLKNAFCKAVEKWSEREVIREAFSIQIASFLNKAKGLEDRGLADAALDLVYDSIDELFRRGQFALFDAILSETQPGQYSADILLAILTATATAKSKLAMRQNFFNEVRATLKARKEYEHGLLDGLE